MYAFTFYVDVMDVVVGGGGGGGGGGGWRNAKLLYHHGHLRLWRQSVCTIFDRVKFLAEFRKVRFKKQLTKKRKATAG